MLREIAKLVELGRIKVDLDDADLTRVLARIHVWPITLELCRTLRALGFHSDPTDQLIAAATLRIRIQDVPGWTTATPTVIHRQHAASASLFRKHERNVGNDGVVAHLHVPLAGQQGAVPGDGQS